MWSSASCLGSAPIHSPPESLLHTLSSTKQWLGAGGKLSLLCTLSHGDLCFCSTLCCSSNTSLLNQHLFISRRASRFRTSSAALVPSGGNTDHGKIKKMNQPISLWKAKWALKWCEGVYLGAGLCILRSSCWMWESGIGISFLPYWKDSGYHDICHIRLTDLQENYVLGVSHRQ